MKILKAEYVQSTVAPGRQGEGLPEVAITGRSNVGKSSLINSFLNRKKLAKVSRTPGKTRTLNFFRVETTDPRLKAFLLVDLPGYGYAEVAKATRAQWRPMIEAYLGDRPALRGVLMLVDARHATDHDAAMAAWLQSRAMPAVVIATKIDKLARAERRERIAEVREVLALSATTPVIAYSSVTREGEQDLWAALRELLAE